MATCELIEQASKLSVAFWRDVDVESGKALKAAQSLADDQTVRVIQALARFSHLANLAEDHHHLLLRHS